MTLFMPFICINSFSSSDSLRKWVILYSYFIDREVKTQIDYPKFRELVCGGGNDSNPEG